MSTKCELKAMHEIKADKCHHKGWEISEVCSYSMILLQFLLSTENS